MLNFVSLNYERREIQKITFSNGVVMGMASLSEILIPSEKKIPLARDARKTLCEQKAFHLLCKRTELKSDKINKKLQKIIRFESV